MKTTYPDKICQEEFKNFYIIRKSSRWDLLENYLACFEPEDLRRLPRAVNWIEFTIKFKNKYPEKLYLVKDKIRWEKLPLRRDLTVQMILDLSEYIDFSKLSKYVLTNKIIELYGTRLDPKAIAQYSQISVENVERYKDYLDWKQLSLNYDASLEFIQRYFKYIGEDLITDFAARTSDISVWRAYEHLIKFSGFFSHRVELPFDLLEKGIEQFNDKRYADWWYVRKLTYLTEEFIMKYFDELSEVSTQDESKRSIYRILKNNGLLKKSERSNDFEKFLQERTKGKLGNF